MLDQYRQDQHLDNDHLGEGRFQMSRRKVVFTLAGAALALLFFLFIIGAFRAEDEIASEKEVTGAVASELVDLQARVEKLEQMVTGSNLIAQRPQASEPNNAAMSDNTLKQLIASNVSDDQNSFDPEVIENQDFGSQPQMTQVQQAPPAPAPVKVAPKTYVIQKGDSLSKISQKFYGTTKKWKMIYDANRDRINNINNLKVGTTITIPEDPAK